MYVNGLGRGRLNKLQAIIDELSSEPRHAVSKHQM